MKNTMSKRVAVGAVVLSAILSLNVGTSNAGIIGYGLTSGSRGLGLINGSGLVLTNLFSPTLADFMVRTGLIS